MIPIIRLIGVIVEADVGILHALVELPVVVQIADGAVDGHGRDDAAGNFGRPKGW